MSVAACGWIQEVTQSWSVVLVTIALHYVVGAVVFCLWVGDREVGGT